MNACPASHRTLPDILAIHAIAIVLSIAAPVALHAQLAWVRVSGLEGADVGAFFESPAGSMHAVGAAGSYRFDNRSESWVLAPGSHGIIAGTLTANDVGGLFALASADPIRRVATLLRSTDDGASWAAVGMADEIAMGANDRVVLVRNDSLSFDEGATWRRSGLRDIRALLLLGERTMMASLRDSVVRSVDGGILWQRVWSAARFVSATSHVLVLDSSTAISVGEDASVGVLRGVHRTLDGGASWQVVSTLPFRSLTKAADGTLLATINQERSWWGGNGIYHSTDVGATWTRTATTAPLTMLMSSSGELFLGDAPHVYRSLDMGVTIARTENGLHERRARLWSQSDGTIIGLVDGLKTRVTRYADLVRSTDDGMTWQLLEDSLWSCAPLPGTGEFVATVTPPVPDRPDSLNYITMVSSSGGTSWRRLAASYPTAVASDGNGRAAVALFHARPEHLFTTTDAGRTWTGTATFLPRFYSLAMSTDGAMYLADGGGSPYGGVYRSDDLGRTSATHWDSSPIEVLVIGTTVLARTLPGFHLFRSTNRGRTWQANWSPAQGSVESLVIDSSGALLAEMRERTVLLSYSVSTDGGATWATDPPEWPQAAKPWPTPFGEILAADNIGLHRSMNHGLNWSRLDTAIAKFGVFSATANARVIIASTSDNGVFRTTRPGIGGSPVAHVSEELLVTPNPARDRITIELGSGRGSTIRLRDVRGTIVRSVESSPEDTRCVVNVGDLPTGMYLIEATAVAGVRTCRVAIVR